MKLFNALVLFSGFISHVLASASNYQITYYGCPDECYAQEHPSCGIKIYPDNSNKYFCALSKKLSGYDKYCGQRVVVMLTDGSKTMVNVQVVDSCKNCEKYHVDLSSYSFSHLLNNKHGVANVIWGIYNSSGSKLLGPIYDSLGNAPSKFRMSPSDFVSAFDANASKMAKNGKNVGDFSSSASDSNSKPTTTTKKTITTTAVVQKPTNSPQQPSQTKKTALSPKETTNNSLPPKSTNSTLPSKATDVSTINATKTLLTSTKSLTGTGPAKTVNPSKTKKPDDIVAKEIAEKDNNPGATVGIVACIGGGILGAAGVGLLLMKKKSPGTYEDMKQKFPEAFNQVKRGISRRATSIKRRVTRKVPNTNTTVV